MLPSESVVSGRKRREGRMRVCLKGKEREGKKKREW